MTTTDLLARIDKLGPEWQDPDAELLFLFATSHGASHDRMRKLCLKLHCRHIAERLAELDDIAGNVDSYAEALVSAAEAVGGKPCTANAARLPKRERTMPTTTTSSDSSCTTARAATPPSGRRTCG